ncbi:hypothetical protein [Streptomyces sp. NPDC050848]|uniref:hypothetical protein n=1 Tax=Streptomyces sp. NPDC050848 TaxID=3155791 RepID=UPI0033C436E5
MHQRPHLPEPRRHAGRARPALRRAGPIRLTRRRARPDRLLRRHHRDRLAVGVLAQRPVLPREMAQALGQCGPGGPRLDTLALRAPRRDDHDVRPLVRRAAGP